jgi:glycine oxidase
VKVTIVGGGVIGFAVACELAARGVQVVVIDARGGSQGATRASAGMLAPYIEGHAPPLLQLGVRGLAEYDGFLARLAADSRQPVEYRRTGTLQVACSGEEGDELASHARHLTQRGVTAGLLDALEVRRLEPALAATIQCGLLIPEHGYVAVPTLMAALTEAARTRGATVTIGRVTRIRSDGASPSVDTADGSITCDAVVLAAGSWSGGIPMDPAGPAPVRPVRGQLLHLRPSGPALSRVVWGTGGYLVPWEDGSVLVGATVEEVGFDDRLTAGGIRHLLDAGAALMPSLGDAAFEDARAGLRPATPDELPVIGPSSTMRGVFYATGHYRNGVLLAPLTALMIADLLLDQGRRPELDLVRPGRFGL